jgi:quinolinate synthase
MRRENPGRTFLTVPGADESCSCNECPYMKRNTLQKLYLCLRDRAPEIAVPEDLRVAALRPIERMLALG